MWTPANSSTHLLTTIGDPDATRTVTSIVVLLIALGLGLVMIAVWLWRTTRPDPELLAPLELMGERNWRRADPVAQRRRLDAARPEGAEPLEPSTSPPVLDQTFDAGPRASGFDDLDVDDEPEIGRIRSMQSLPSVMPQGEATPRQIDRPEADVFAHDIDPEVLAAADAELQAELDANLDGRHESATGTDEPVGGPAPGESEVD